MSTPHDLRFERFLGLAKQAKMSVEDVHGLPRRAWVGCGPTHNPTRVLVGQDRANLAIDDVTIGTLTLTGLKSLAQVLSTFWERAGRGEQS